MDTGRRSIWTNGDGIKQSGSRPEFLEYVLSQQQQVEEKTPIITNGTVAVSPLQETPSTLTENLLTPESDQQVDVIETVAADKTSEWVRNTEFEATPESDVTVTESDRTLTELLDHVAELDEIYEDHQLRRDSDHVEQELRKLEQALPKSEHEERNDFDELFDDAATYTSLQIAFKNPISILKPYSAPLIAPPPPAHSTTPENLHYDAVEPTALYNPPAPIIDVKRDGLRKDDPNPPLPPKRAKKPMPLPPGNEENQNRVVEENHITASTNESPRSNTISRRSSAKSLPPRPQSQIIIMRSPSESPLNKKLPPAPPLSNGVSCSTLPRPKKPGFFSKLFSRRKSKSDLASTSTANLTSKSSTDISRQPSIHSLGVAQTQTTEGSNVKSRPSNRNKSGRKVGKPCGRSVSSVSGKRPHLTADIVHIPLKGDSTDSLPMRSGGSLGHGLTGSDAYERSSTTTLSNNLDRKTVSALQLADLPMQEGNMELIAIADRQSLKNLCESEFGVVLDPSVDLTEAEHYALYTSVAPHATESEFDEASAYYAPVEAGEILTQDEVARRLAGGYA